MSKKNKPLFEVTQQDLDRQTGLNQERIDTTLFILPENDGEAARSVQILRALGAPFIHVSAQKWGATLDKEWSKLNLGTLNKVKNVLIFEMPGEQVGDSIETEEKLKAHGVDLHIVDHHYYQWVDRHHTKASIEQLCEYLGWQMGEIDQAIAVNDRSYIPGMKALNIPKETIIRVRLFDLESQGNKRNYIDKQLKQARKDIESLREKKHGDLWVLDDPDHKQPYIMQELAIEDPIGLIHALEIKPHKVGFSGKPEVVQFLMKQDWSTWQDQTGPLISYGGGDARSSQFWGLKISDSGSKITPELVSWVSQKVKEYF